MLFIHDVLFDFELGWGFGRDRDYSMSRFNSDRLNRYSPVGVRLGLSFFDLIQRRIVGMLMPRCMQAVLVFTQGSDSAPGSVVVSFVFMVS
jgi:hypothetical protein